MDSLLSLRVLDAVAELRSFTAAAERLSLSPAMASKHVQHVEAQVGARLLNRTSRSVSLTEAGALYLARVRPLLEGLAEAEAEVSQTAVRPRGRLRVSLPVWMANPTFAALVARFHQRHEEVVLDLDFSAPLVNLVEEGFDLAIRVTMSPEPGLIARRLGEVNFSLVAAPGFLRRAGLPRTLADLAGAPLMTYSQLNRDGRIPLPTEAGPVEVQFRPVVISDNEMLLLHAVREGLGYSVLPDWLVEPEIAEGHLVPVLPGLARATVPLFAVYPDRSYLPAKVRSFLDFLVEIGFPRVRGTTPSNRTTP